MITYLDRAMMGSAKGDIMGAVGQPTEKFFYLLVAFQIAYAMFEVPSGWMGDRIRPAFDAVAHCALVVVLHRLDRVCGHDDSGLEVRCCIGFTAARHCAVFLRHGRSRGVSQHHARPCTTGSPHRSAGSAQGTIWLSARFMGGMTPMIWVVLTENEFAGLTWRQAIWVSPGSPPPGAWSFTWWFRNVPDGTSRRQSGRTRLDRRRPDAARRPCTAFPGKRSCAREISGSFAQRTW